MRILFLPTWRVESGGSGCDVKQPNFYPGSRDYWFFKHWPGVEVDVLDTGRFGRFEDRHLHFFATQSLRALPKLSEYDLVISHGAQSGILLAAMRSMAGRAAPPHVVVDVGCFAAGRSSTLLLAPIRFAMRSVAKVIYHASVQERFYRAHLPEISGRSSFVHLGVDPDFFHPLEAKQEGYILTIGYGRFRDWRVLAEAFRPLARRIELRVVGFEGKLDCPNARVEPPVSIERLKELMAESRLVFLPLPEMPFAFGQTTLLGAMSMGKAVVATTSSGVGDYLRVGENCLAASVGDVAALTEKLSMLLDDARLRDELGRSARATVVDYFNEERMVTDFRRVLSDLLPGGSGVVAREGAGV